MKSGANTTAILALTAIVALLVAGAIGLQYTSHGERDISPVLTILIGFAGAVALNIGQMLKQDQTTAKVEEAKAAAVETKAAVDETSAVVARQHAELRTIQGQLNGDLDRRIKDVVTTAVAEAVPAAVDAAMERYTRPTAARRRG